MVISAAYKAIRRVIVGGASLVDRFAFVFCFIALAYNWTESDFFRLEPLWFAFLLFTFEPQLGTAKEISEGTHVPTSLQLSRV
jgi:hypothetical protein